MPHRIALPALIALSIVVWTAPVAGQSALVLDIRGGAAIPVGSFTSGPDGGGDLGPAASLGLHFALRRNDHVGFYAGFTQARIDCREDGCPGDHVYVSTAWDLGLHIYLGRGRRTPWIRGGVVLARVERDLLLDGDVVHRVSDLGVGAEVGLGMRLPVGGRFTLSPGVRYTKVDTDFTDAPALAMRYLVADIGLVVGF